MLSPKVPADEAARLRRLRALDLLDGPAENGIDAFTRLATRMTGMPVGLVSLVDERRQWLQSAVGCIPQGSQAGRDVSFCAHAILDDTLFEVEDARIDPRFADNPLVTGPPHVVHYAGAPLVMPGGERIGTLCLISHEPGRLGEQERDLLAELARMLVGWLLLRESDRAQRRAASIMLGTPDLSRTPGFQQQSGAVQRAVRDVDVLRQQLQQELAAP